MMTHAMRVSRLPLDQVERILRSLACPGECDEEGYPISHNFYEDAGMAEAMALPSDVDPRQCSMRMWLASREAEYLKLEREKRLRS